MTTPCERCGSFAGLRSRKRRMLCREHFHRAALPVALLFAAELVGLSGWFGVLAEVSPRAAALWALPAVALVVVVHEAAHAGVAALTGLRVSWISLGTGPRLGVWRPGGRTVEVRLLPVTGYVVVTPRGDPRRWRWRLAWLACVASGPVVNVAAFAYAVGTAVTPFSMAVLSAAAMIVASDVAGIVARGDQMHSDLRHLVRRAFRPVPVAFDTPTGWAVSSEDYLDDVETVMQAVHANRPGRAAGALARLRAVTPAEPQWQLIESWVLVERRQWTEAAALLRPVRSCGNALLAAAAAGTLGWLAAMRGDVAAAEDHVHAARWSLPDDAALDIVEALVAALAGRLDAAEALLARAEPRTGNDPALASIAAIRAYVVQCRGDAARAASLAATARELDPDCQELDLL
jgi:hypothetical protein